MRSVSPDTPTAARLRVAAAVAVSLVAAAGAFAFRFLAFRGLPNDQYMQLAWAQQVLYGALPGRDFWEPGMPLAIALSAAAQAWMPGPFSEGVLSIAALAIAAGVTCYVVTSASRSFVAGLAAAALQIALFPRLYSYPKVLVPVVAVFLLHLYVQRRSTARLVALAAWAVVGFLLRHDLGVMAAVAILVGLLATATPWRDNTREAARFVGVGLLLVTPYLLFLQWHEGVAEHIRVGMEFGKAEAHQFLFFDELPPVPSPDGFVHVPESTDDAAALLFWLTHAALAAVVIVAVAQRHHAGLFPLLVATTVLIVAYRIEILRHPVAGRIQDLAGVVALAVGLCAGSLLTGARIRLLRKPAAAAAGAVCAAALVIPWFLGGWSLGRLADELDETNLLRGPEPIRQQAEGVIAAGMAPEWDQYWPAGQVPLVTRYLRECTSPDDRVFMTWSAPEFYYFARRPFGSGNALLLPGTLSGQADQRQMVQRLETERVPVVLVNESRLAEFEGSFPLLAGFIRERYATRGRFTIRDGSEIALAIRRDLSANRTFGEDEWPCEFVRLARHALYRLTNSAS